MEKEKKQQSKSPKKKEEHLSRRDLRELMGESRQTYKRNRHGAITNKN